MDTTGIVLSIIYIELYLLLNRDKQLDELDEFLIPKFKTSETRTNRTVEGIKR